MTDAPASNRLVVAAFDVDGTLTRRDCVVPYLRRAAGRFHLYRAFLRHPAASVKALVARDRDSLKAIAISALKGRRWLDLVAIGEMYASEIARDNLRDDTVRRLSWHRAAGHRVVLVSASLRPYLVPLGMHLGVDAILCCEIEVGPDGVATGRIDGLNCRGAEKVRRLRQWMAGQGLADRAEVWAYGDSTGDRDLLGAANRSFLVRGVELPTLPGEVRS